MIVVILLPAGVLSLSRRVRGSVLHLTVGLYEC